MIEPYSCHCHEQGGNVWCALQRRLTVLDVSVVRQPLYTNYDKNHCEETGKMCKVELEPNTFAQSLVCSPIICGRRTRLLRVVNVRKANGGLSIRGVPTTVTQTFGERISILFRLMLYMHHRGKVGVLDSRTASCFKCLDMRNTPKTPLTYVVYIPLRHWVSI